MKTLYYLLFFLFILISGRLSAQAQDSALVCIETRDGNEFVGTISREDTHQIVLKTENLGEITIQKSDIKRRTKISPKQIKGSGIWLENPQATRYFWAPNGYGLKKGEGYYQNIYVFWNQASIGITNNFSLGGGIVPLFLLDGPTPVFITPKLSVPVVKNKINLGAGALLGAVLGEESGAFGIVYGLSTYGNPNKNFTIGLGYGFADGEWANSPLINISGLCRISSRMYFVTENYYINMDGEGWAVTGLGGRWLIKRASLDFMLGIPLAKDMDTFIAVPAIGFVIPF